MDKQERDRWLDEHAVQEWEQGRCKDCWEKGCNGSCCPPVLGGEGGIDG